MGKDITENKLKERNVAYGYADRFDEKYDMVRSVRVDNMKYMRNYQPFNFDGLWNNYRYKQTGYREWWEMYKAGELNEAQSLFFSTKAPEALYDLEADPYEANNLANDPVYKEQLLAMRGKLNSWVKGMPDLSFYPEFYLVNKAFDNPVAFGQKHKTDINGYIEIADLQLLDYSVAKDRIEAALNSTDEWKRYWGLIVCSRFEKEAIGLLPKIKEIAANDSEIINRVRAAEFMGITKSAKPQDVIYSALYESTDPVETLLVLNSVVLLKDGFDYKFAIETNKMNEKVANDSQVARRLEYLK